MQRADEPRDFAAILCGRPNVGALLDLCEENYRRLIRLAPDLQGRTGVYTSYGADTVLLQLEILERAPFTTTLRLTHLFPSPDSESQALDLDPDARLRVYHDSHQVEILDVRQSSLSPRADYQPPALLEKWRANLFLGKWLVYCLRQGHQFGKSPVDPGTLVAARRETGDPASRALTPEGEQPGFGEIMG